MPDGSLDIQEITRKYEEERLKRTRADGNKQYRKLEGVFGGMKADPHTPFKQRPPQDREVEVATLGAGWGAILVGMNLRLAGVDDICVIDKAGDFGGVWYWNRYPGVACDTESYVYMPLLEEMGVMPRTNFASGAEILAHAQNIAKKFDLYRGALLQTGIEDARWDDASSRWIIRTDRGDTIRAKYFIMTSGSLQVPKLPGIPGIETFKGKQFHTSRWDYDYTGGDSSGNLTRLQDKRVAIIGTGATAVQCIPHLGKWAKELYVFQRTPSSIDVRNERPTDAAWWKSQPKGWQMKRIENFTSLLSMLPVKEDLVNDGWTKPTFGVLQTITPDMTPEQIGQRVLEADIAQAEVVRHRVDEIVRDKATAEALKAWYPRLCKRPCFHDDYLPTFNRPSVHLIDTQGKGVDRVTENGIVANGVEYPVDCIIYSTGFELGPYADAPAVPLTGKGGVTLAQKWAEGATTMHGFHVHGFPNFYNIGITQSAWGPNFIHMLLRQGEHVAYIIKALRERGATVAEVSAEAEKAWTDHHVELAPLAAKTWENCTPGFFNNEGDLNRRTLRSGPYAGGVMGLIDVFRKWREAGKLEGLEIR